MTEKEAEPTAEERLAALLADLAELGEYLAERGRHTYDLAQRFMEHAQQDRDASSRAYDERQATMLDYQHYIWSEIAGLVSRLVTTYSPADSEPADPPPETES
jgi:hypothetical protein